MDTTVPFLSRLQLAFTLSFHIIFPAKCSLAAAELQQQVEDQRSEVGNWHFETVHRSRRHGSYWGQFGKPTLAGEQ